MSRDFYFHDSTHRKFEWFSGYYGPRNKIKLWTLIFKNKPIDIAFTQEQYWQNGNQNEVVVCIGVDEKLKFQWVKVFSWCDNKRICVDTREDLMNLGVLNANGMIDIYTKNVKKYYHYKSFKDFNYLTFEPTTKQVATVYLLSFFISLILIIIFIKVDFENNYY